jgi:serine/threonine protein kinase
MLTDLGLLTVSQSSFTSTFPGTAHSLRNDTTYTAHSDAGSVRWMAPELFENPSTAINGEEEARSGRSTRSDVYAFGMTMLEVRANRNRVSDVL